MSARYNTIGQTYAQTRREDPHILARIEEALGDARTVVNVGAGTGSYEPRDRYVLAVEPSDVMARQRSADRVPAITGSASKLPFRDGSVDAAMTVLSLHHWDEERERGLAEMRRVARGPVVIVTVDPVVSEANWLMADYFEEVAELDHRVFPTMETMRAWLGPNTEIDAIPIRRDTPDWNLLSFWAHPERVLDANARAGTSGFARMPDAVVDRVVASVGRDLDSGVWDRKHGHLRALDAFDAGLRIVVHPRP